MIKDNQLRFYSALLQWDSNLVTRHLDELFAHFAEAGELPDNVLSGNAPAIPWITNRLMKIYQNQFIED